MAAVVAVRGQDPGIALAGSDGTDDAHAGHPGDISNDMMQLQVHLHQRLLHVLDVGRGIIEQPLTLAQVRPQSCDLAFGLEAGA